MAGKSGLLLVAILAVLSGLAGPVFATTEGRVGVGINMTEYEPDSPYFIPKFAFATDQFALDIGMNFHSGENQTNFHMQGGISFKAIRMHPAAMAFGAQFDMITDYKGDGTAIGFGAFGEIGLDVTPHLNIGLRGYPFVFSHHKESDRFGVLAAGLSMTYFF